MGDVLKLMSPLRVFRSQDRMRLDMDMRDIFDICDILFAFSFDINIAVTNLKARWISISM
jgi:hypothetical protein